MYSCSCSLYVQRVPGRGRMRLAWGPGGVNLYIYVLRSSTCALFYFSFTAVYAPGPIEFSFPRPLDCAISYLQPPTAAIRLPRSETALVTLFTLIYAAGKEDTQAIRAIKPK